MLSKRSRSIALRLLVLLCGLSWVAALAIIIDSRGQIAGAALTTGTVVLFVLPYFLGTYVAHALTDSATATVVAFFFPVPVLFILIFWELFEDFPITKAQRNRILYSEVCFATYPNMEIIRRLLKKPVELNQKKGEDTLLLRSYMKRNLALFLELLDAGADPDIAGKGGWTALMVACERGDDASIGALLDKKANIEASNDEGESPLHIAVRNNRTDAVRSLIEHGAAPDPMTKQGLTALMLAVKGGLWEITEILVAGAADVNLGNESGSTPLSQALENNQMSMTDFLISKGARADESTLSKIESLKKKELDRKAEEQRQRKEARRKASQATFDGLRTESPVSAVKALFHSALPSLSDSTEEEIGRVFQSYSQSWGSNTLLKGSIDELLDRVAMNLEWSAKEPGFAYFQVSLVPESKMAFVMTFGEKGASAAVLKTREAVYLFGNSFFRY